jgi:protein gp37
MEDSKIEWTDHTFNPWIGCQGVSPGCDHCYAETMMDHRYGKVEWGPHGASGPPRKIGKNPSNGMPKPVCSKGSMAIDRGFFVRRSVTPSTKRFRQSSAKTCLR